MADEAGGAAPRRGFRFQDLAAAFFFITDYPDIFPHSPETLHVERYDSDFAFRMESDGGSVDHFFEVKHIKAGELKWGDKFKSEVFPEFYRISEKHASTGKKDQSFYHLVTNGAVSSRISGFAEDTASLRYGTHWEVIKEKRGRKDITNLLSGVNSNSVVENDEEVDDADDIDALYRPLWGLEVHTPSEEELKAKLENYLRKCSPTRFRGPMAVILDVISDESSGAIRKADLEEKIGFRLDGGSSTATSAETMSTSELQANAKDISQSYSSNAPDTPRLKRERDIIRELGNRASKSPGSDPYAVESAQELADEQLSKLMDLEQETAATETQAQQQIDIMLSEMEGQDTSTQGHE
ncbi:hypothetical protein [Halomarina rubra]|uniref:DUF4297 domain-containing protein n=1 Tax=Halomarina rubra TaxID=2071873 RepID=A0ABD6AZV8_9EURY|nr:hypothetical protein [Halomarina rubra]